MNTMNVKDVNVSPSAHERFERELERAKAELKVRGNPYAFADDEEVSYTGDEDFDEILRECVEVMGTKGVDYAGGSKDRLHNFRQAAEDLDISMQKVLYTYIWKHLSALTRYCRGEDLRSESLRGRIVDSINYLLILWKISQDGQEVEADVDDSSWKIVEWQVGQIAILDPDPGTESYRFSGERVVLTTRDEHHDGWWYVHNKEIDKSLGELRVHEKDLLLP